MQALAVVALCASGGRRPEWYLMSLKIERLTRSFPDLLPTISARARFLAGNAIEMLKDGTVLGKKIGGSRRSPEQAIPPPILAREWSTRRSVDAIFDLVSTITRSRRWKSPSRKQDHGRVGRRVAPITNEKVYGRQRALGIRHLASLSCRHGQSLVKQGKKTWFFVTAGLTLSARRLERDASRWSVATAAPWSAGQAPSRARFLSFPAQGAGIRR